MLQQFAAALFLLSLGLAFCFAGSSLFRFLVPLWGFLIGFVLGADGAVLVLGSGFLGSALSALCGFVVGLLGAAFAFFLFDAAVALLGASVGVLAGTAIMEGLGARSNAAVALVALVAGAAGLAVTLAFRLPRLLIITLTALAGASAVVAGGLLMLNRIPLDRLEYGPAGAAAGASWLWGLAWVVLAGAGMAVQSRSKAEPAPQPKRSHGSAR